MPHHRPRHLGGLHRPENPLEQDAIVRAERPIRHEHNRRSSLVAHFISSPLARLRSSASRSGDLASSSTFTLRSLHHQVLLANRGAVDRRVLALGKDDRKLRTNPRARRAAVLARPRPHNTDTWHGRPGRVFAAAFAVAVVLAFVVQRIHAEQAKSQTLSALHAPQRVNHRIPRQPSVVWLALDRNRGGGRARGQRWVGEGATARSAWQCMTRHCREDSAVAPRLASVPAVCAFFSFSGSAPKRSMTGPTPVLQLTVRTSSPTWQPANSNSARAARSWHATTTFGPSPAANSASAGSRVSASPHRSSTIHTRAPAGAAASAASIASRLFGSARSLPAHRQYRTLVTLMLNRQSSSHRLEPLEARARPLAAAAGGRPRTRRCTTRSRPTSRTR